MEFTYWIDLTKKAPPPAAPVEVTVSGPETALWQAIRDFPLDQPDASMPFSVRLARDHLWTPDYAGKVVGEYRRFLYLMATEPEMVTPSEDVDEAWHLHLAYTKSYWDELCGKVVNRPLHHTPTEGEEQGDDFRKAYERTLERYRKVFKEDPPNDVWPSIAERFALEGGFRTVPLRDFRLVGRRMTARLPDWLLSNLPVPFFLLFGLLGIHIGLPGPFVVIGPLVGFFVGGLFQHWLKEIALPRWGRKGLGFAKYQNEPQSSAGGCGGCGGCG
jgi:hypothetical protein